jgi:glycosyltransferase involved in cell wall biosynthesis
MMVTINTMKVILISYYFSSRYETGGIRAQKFAKYLPAFGVEPIIVTRRTKDPFPFSGKCLYLRTFPIHWPFHLESFTWIPGLFWACLKLVKNENAKYLIFSCGPFPPAIVGVFLKKFFNVKFLLDYRDYWTLSPYVPQLSTFHRFINQLFKPFERWILRSTDQLILIQKEMENHYLNNFPFLKGKTATIFNGFDEEDILKTKEEGFNKITLLYLGNLHPDLNKKYPILFLKNLQEMKFKRVLDESNFQMFIVGERFKIFEEWVEELGLSSIVKTLGRLPHTEAMQFLIRSHILLLIVETEGIITSKIFEYIASGKPILALIKPGELMDLIKEFSPNSTIITSYDSKEIMNGLQRCLSINRYHAKQREENKRFINTFNRKELTRKLVEIINKLS